MINKSPETDIKVQANDQKSKTAKPLGKSYLYRDWVTEPWVFVSSHYVLSFSAGIKDLWLPSTGIKGVWATTTWICFCNDLV